ncbi:hypothetical protein RB594_006400 [Gaeumannomyces avenae]
MFSLQGHTALVTGGTRGIGQAVAIGLAEAGADVLLVQHDESSTATRDAILALGRKAQIYTADLSDPASVAALTPKVLADGHEVRVLVNCAGIQRRHKCEAFPDADFAEVMQVNLGAVFALTRATLLSFEGGLTVPAYAASKGAVAQLTKSFANEWTSRGVTQVLPRI